MRLIATLILIVMLFISPVFLSSGAFGETQHEAAEKTAPHVAEILDAEGLYIGKFPLKKVGSRYVPESKNDFNDMFTIPGTEITAGGFHYEYIDELTGWNPTYKAVALIHDSIYYVDSSDKKYRGSYDISGPNFLIYKNYFTIDACTLGASACRRMMFLFRYTKDSVEILDYVESTDFEFQPETDFNDIDNDGNPELKVSIHYSSIKSPTVFKLFFEIKDNRLQVDFNPELYKPLFKEMERKSRNKTDKPDAYYFYGFMSGKLSLKKIQTMLAGKKEPSGKEPYIIRIIKKRDTWDADFHNHYIDKPVLIRHNLKNQKEVE